MWLHKLLHPHCPDCREYCASCEVLRGELERAHRENEILLNKILNPITETVVERVQENVSPVTMSGGRRFIPYSVKQQMIDENDKRTIQIMNDAKKKMKDALTPTTEELEEDIIGQINQMRDSEVKGAG